MSRPANVGGRAGALVTAAFLAALAAAVVAVPARAQMPVTLEGRGGVAIPAGALANVADPGAGFGAGLVWRIHDRAALRADGDLEIMSEALAGPVVMPRSYLWHLHGGLELALTNPESARWLVRARGGAGATIYDTERFFPGGDDFLDTYFSVSGGLSVGRHVASAVEVGVLGQAFITFAERERTTEFADRSPTVLYPFREASSFPVGLYLRWSPR